MSSSFYILISSCYDINSVLISFSSFFLILKNFFCKLKFQTVIIISFHFNLNDFSAAIWTELIDLIELESLYFFHYAKLSIFWPQAMWSGKDDSLIFQVIIYLYNYLDFMYI